MTEKRLKKWTLLRRSVQLGSVALIASPLAGVGIFRGNLESASLMGVKLSDPLAALQVMLASGVVLPAFIFSALLVAAFYFVLGGRTFCAWVCPVHLVTELGDKVRSSLRRGERTFPLSWKKWLLALTLVVTLLTGLPLFEIVSPIGIFNRALVFGSWTGLFMLGGIVVAETAVARRLWCRSLCPLGGFYSILGRYSPVKVRFSQAACSGCGDCVRICPVEEVLQSPIGEREALVKSGECTRCGECVDICPTRAITFTAGYK